MNTHANELPMLKLMTLPTLAQADAAVGDARRMFARTLSCWASDVLVLRRRGAHLLTWPDAAAGQYGVRKAA